MDLAGPLKIKVFGAGQFLLPIWWPLITLLRGAMKMELGSQGFAPSMATGFLNHVVLYSSVFSSVK
jgi:hypothetical protein